MSVSQQAASQFILILLIILVFYFLLIRPQIKRQREREQLIAGIQTGDRILTIGGILGNVVEIKENVIMLEVAKNVILEMSKSAVAEKVE